MTDPRYTRHWMRVALLWRDTLVAETLADSRAPVTIGAGRKNTLVVPDLADVGERHLLFTPDPGGFTLLPTHAMSGRLHLAGAAERSLDATRQTRGNAIQVGGRDWGVIDLSPDLAVFFRCVAPPDRVPRRPLWASLESSMLGALLGAVVLHLGLLVAAFLFWDAAPAFATIDDVGRITRFIDEPPPEEIEEPEPEEAIAEETSKRAPDEEGVFGEPEKVVESKVPKTEGELVDKIKNVGIHQALVSPLLGRGPMANVFGDKTGFDSKLNAAMAGADGVLVVGRGTEGMGLRGTGDGGGGPGGFGRIRAMGRIDTGGGPGTRARLGGRTQQPKKPKVRVAAGAVGTFCKEQDILRVVAARQRGIQYCYEKELAQNPELQGKVTVSWRIMLDGSVSKALVESGIGNRSLEGCMTRQINRWRFPNPEGGMCRVQFPFVFNAGL